jgi:hypothetical protein
MQINFSGDASNNGQHMVEFQDVFPVMMIWYHREWPEFLPVQRPDMKRTINFSYEWRDCTKTFALKHFYK